MYAIHVMMFPYSINIEFVTQNIVFNVYTYFIVTTFASLFNFLAAGSEDAVNVSIGNVRFFTDMSIEHSINRIL